MNGHMYEEAQEQVFTFRGKSMREVVLQLKDALGENAVIQSTQRVREPGGGYVEITARPGPKPRIPSQANQAQPLQKKPVSHQLGHARGPGAYARTAKATNVDIAKATQSGVRTLAATQRLVSGKETPFAERAAWLAAQIEQRQREDGISAAVDTPSQGLPPELQALQRGALPAGQTQQVSAPSASDRPQSYAEIDPITVDAADEAQPAQRSEVDELRAELAELKKLITAQERSEDDKETPTESAIEADKSTGVQSALIGLESKMGDLIELIQAEQAVDQISSQEILSERLQGIGILKVHADDLASRVLRAIPEGTVDDGDVLALLEGFMGDDIMSDQSFSQVSMYGKVMAFVGPTGVGKTTTIAKVASQARLDGKRVALITVDTCRAAAVEQLAAYADVLHAPLRVVKRADELRSALDELSGHDLILVDTNGRNPRETDQVQDLKAFFPSDWGGELVLTVACSTRESDLRTAVDAFGALGVSRLCITKTDETVDVGVVYSLARRACRPLTWTTNGQRVPDDIEVANGAAWARALIAELSRRDVIRKAS